MIDGFRTEMDVHVDTMAERVVQLGGIALGTTQTVAQGSRLKAYPLDLVSVKDHITALEERYGVLASSIRSRGCRHSRYLHRVLTFARQSALVPGSP